MLRGDLRFFHYYLVRPSNSQIDPILSFLPIRVFQKAIDGGLGGCLALIGFLVACADIGKVRTVVLVVFCAGPPAWLILLSSLLYPVMTWRELMACNWSRSHHILLPSFYFLMITSIGLYSFAMIQKRIEIDNLDLGDAQPTESSEMPTM